MKSLSSWRLTRCLKWSTRIPMICCQFKMRFLWHVEEEESFYTRIWYTKNSTQWIYSPCEKLEHQELAPLHLMWRPLVRYIFRTSHMAKCYDFVLKLERRYVKIIRKNLEKIWEKDKEKLSGKSCKKGGEIFSKCCLCAIRFGFSMC